MKKAFIMSALVGLMATGCQSTDSLFSDNTPVNVVDTQLLSNVHQVGVKDINGNSEYLSAELVTEQLKSHLASLKVDEQKRFELVPNPQADALLVVDYEVKSKKFGNGDLGGTTSNCSGQTSRNEGNGICITSMRKPKHCTERRARVDFTPKLVSATDGKVILEKTYSVIQGSRFCMDRQDKRLAATDELASEALATILKRFGDDIANRSNKLPESYRQDDKDLMAALK